MSSSQFTLIDPPTHSGNSLVNSIEELVARRNSLGLSLETLAQQLRLAPKQLQHIEASEFSAMSSPAFARAVLRAYAKAVNVDADPIIRTIGHYGEAAELHDSSNINQPVETRGMMGFGQAGPGSKWAWALLGVAGLAVLAFFFSPSPKDFEKFSSVLATKPSPPRVANAPAVAAPVNPAPMVVAPTSADLKFDLKGSAWVEVIQVIGGVETTQMFTHSGSDIQSYAVTVKLPTTVVMGNTEAIAISRDGKLLDMKSLVAGSLGKVVIE
jgi:transcriptional regulator with XRE-family HTH domain